MRGSRSSPRASRAVTSMDSPRRKMGYRSSRTCLPTAFSKASRGTRMSRSRSTGRPRPASTTSVARSPTRAFRGGLRFQRNAFQAGVDINAVAPQDRVGTLEPPTSGYDLLKAFGAYSFNTGRITNTITARLDNATNTLYRNHLSLIKELVPEMGRNFRLLYDVRF